jgi:hypothetical protein
MWGAEKEDDMAEYLYLFKGGNGQQLSPEQMQKHMQAWMAWIEQLQKRGAFQSGHPLERKGKTLRGKRKTVADGPLAEAKDLVGGYVLVTTNSLDEAVELARGCPILEVDGDVEVRPIQQM